MHSIHLIVHFTFILILFSSFLFHFQFIFILLYFMSFSFQFILTLVILYPSPLNSFSSCSWSNGFHWILSTLNFLSIPVQPPDLLQILIHLWYLIDPKWDAELTIVSIINSTWFHEWGSNLQYIMGTVSVPLDWHMYTFVLAISILTFDIWFGWLPFALWGIVWMVSYVFYFIFGGTIFAEM